MSLEPYRASDALEAFLLRQCGPHFVCNEGTCMTDEAALIRWKEKHGEKRFHVAIPVYPYATDSPFSAEADAAFQAWHDRLHAEYEYEFDVGGEFKLACLHFGLCKQAGLTDEDCLVLYHHVATRVMYHYFHNGDDPPDRAVFVRACFAYGASVAMRGCYMDQYVDHCG